MCELLFFDIPVKFLWKAKPNMSYSSGEPWETTVESINVPHSAAVQAMQCSANNVLVTGGADKKVPFCQSSQSMVLIKLCCAQLFMTDIERRIQTCSTKFSDNVSFLMLNPLDPQLLLITTTGQNNQFTLMDTRTYSTVLKFGWPEVPEFCSFSGALMFLLAADEKSVQLHAPQLEPDRKHGRLSRRWRASGCSALGCMHDCKLSFSFSPIILSTFFF